MPGDKSDFNAMQEEALRRMREMQKRSRTAVSPNTERASLHPETRETPKKAGEPGPSREQRDPIGTLLGDFKIDPEKAMILLMLLILYRNKADMKLLLALGYLLM